MALEAKNICTEVPVDGKTTDLQKQRSGNNGTIVFYGVERRQLTIELGDNRMII